MEEHFCGFLLIKRSAPSTVDASLPATRMYISATAWLDMDDAYATVYKITLLACLFIFFKLQPLCEITCNINLQLFLQHHAFKLQFY